MTTPPEKRQLLIEWEDPTQDIAAATQLTGLAYMQALQRREMRPAPIAVLMDFVLDSVADGHAIFKGTPGERHFNPLGTVHGGYAATLLDSALGCAVHTILPQGKAYGTAQLNIHLTRPITPAVGLLIAEARVLHRGSRSATAEGTLKDENGKLYAHGSATCFIFSLSEG